MQSHGKSGPGVRDQADLLPWVTYVLLHWRVGGSPQVWPSPRGSQASLTLVGVLATQLSEGTCPLFSGSLKLAGMPRLCRVNQA